MTAIISVAIINIKYSITYKLNDNLVNSIYKSKWKFFGGKNIGIILNSLTNIITKITTGISDIAIQLSLVFGIVSCCNNPFIFKLENNINNNFFCRNIHIPN